MSTSRTTSRTIIISVLAVFAVLTGALFGPAQAAPDPGDRAVPQAQKIATDLASQFRELATQDYWVKMTDRADNSAARSIEDWGSRGQAVYDGLRATADESQVAARSLLDRAGADYDSYWLVNAIRVRGGTLGQALELSALPSVASIFAPVPYALIEPSPGVETARVDAVEWGIANINADDVWGEFGVRGEGIVVANIDTGVQFDHPALVEQYRGNLGSGDFDHNYSWFDATGSSDEPFDDNGHGTHTMGTMVGDDGAGNQIGVAPAATWIAANGCNTCSDEDLIASGEWIIAPTDLTGANPDASKRPNIVNNSWGSVIPTNDPFMEDVIIAWEDAGIFGQWSNGNSGPSCATSGSPGSRTVTYSAGAYDINNVIASFSGRGPGQDGEIKPNISAPGVDVRSSVPSDSYAAFSGTSMASPHTAGAIALAMSAAPALIGDVDGIRELLDDTAVDVNDTTCGGTADDNNVWGEGRLDALALLESAPIGDTGTLAGTVTSADTGDPIAGATVTVTGPLDRETTTDEDGTYQLLLPVGTYDVTTSAFGYIAETDSVEITLDGTTTHDVGLEAAETYAVHGKVRSKLDSEPIADATVTVEGTPLTTTTNGNGRYRFDAVPVGTYDVTAVGGGCTVPRTKSLTVDGDERLRFRLAAASDEYGYYCVEEDADYVEADTPVALTGDESTTSIELPFEFVFYGNRYDTAHLSSNGHLNFLSPLPEFPNTELPDPATPNATIAPYWDDLDLLADSAVYSTTGGEAPNRWFTLEYRNAAFYFDSLDQRVDFEVTLYESTGEILFAYRNLDPASDRELGNSTTVGIENADGTVGLEYSYNEPVLEDETAIRFLLPDNGFATGTVTDANDGLPIAGATVRAWQDDEVVREATTDADGEYFLQLPLGAYVLEASKTNYTSATAEITIDEPGETVTTDFVLETGVAAVDPASLEFVLVPGRQQSAEVTITNDGTADLSWELIEVDRGSGRVPAIQPHGQTMGTDGYDAAARDASALYSDEQAAATRPQAPGDVLAEWPAVGLGVPWGIGYEGDVWVSDPELIVNKEYQVDGTPTGVEHDADWAEVWNADMAADNTTGTMCQAEVANVGGDIHCWDPATGDVTYTVPGAGEPWGAISQRGLAYNAADDVFYIGGWNEGIVYTVAGQTHPTPGETLNQCATEDPAISGLAYNFTSGTVWMTTNSPTDTIYQITPSDCATVSTLGDPGAVAFSGAGIELDATGDLWASDQADGVVRLIESGVPQESDVPWMSEEPTSGDLAPGETDTFTVTVDSTGLDPGTTYEATIIVKTNAGRIPNVSIPVQLVVPAYQVGVNAGGDSYEDTSGDLWQEDQPFAVGAWGWTGQRAEVETTTRAIGGTDDDPLYQDRRTGIFQYRFDNLPAGTYAVDLDFAEYSATYLPGRRVFDVRVNGSWELVAHDVAAEVGGLYADQHHVIVEHEGGQLTVEFLNRVAYDFPIINALRVTERSDL